MAAWQSYTQPRRTGRPSQPSPQASDPANQASRLKFEHLKLSHEHRDYELSMLNVFAKHLFLYLTHPLNALLCAYSDVRQGPRVKYNELRTVIVCLTCSLTILNSLYSTHRTCAHSTIALIDCSGTHFCFLSIRNSWMLQEAVRLRLGAPRNKAGQT